MKRVLTIIIAAGLLASCGNKKAEIINKIKLYKDSINLASISKTTIQSRMLHLDDPKLDWKHEEQVLNSEQYKKMKDSVFNLATDIDLFNIRIKSLYLELKKY